MSEIKSCPVPAIVWRGDRAWVGGLCVGEIYAGVIKLCGFMVEADALKEIGADSQTVFSAGGDTPENRQLARAAVEANWARVWGLINS